MRLSTTIRIPLAALVVLLLSQAAGWAADLVRVALPIAVDVPYAPVYAANELGYYAKNGVTVQITAYRGAGAAEAALAAGAADVVNLVPSGAAVAIRKGIKQQIVGCGPQVTPAGWHMLALTKGPVRSLHDLGGKKVGVSSKNSTTDFYALWAAHRAGIRIETVPLGGSEWPALRSKQVAAIVRSPTQSLQLIASGKARSIMDFESAMQANIPECWVATADIIKNKPAAIQGFVKAIEMTIAHMQEDKPYTLSYLRNYLDDPNDAFLELAYDKVIMTLARDERVDLRALGDSLEFAKLSGMTNLPAAQAIVAAFAVKPGSGGH